MAARRGSMRGWGRSVVWLASLAVHAVAVLLLFRSLAREAYVEPPVMQVNLVPPPPMARRPPEPPPPPRARLRAAAPSLRQPPPIAPPTDVAPRYVEARPQPGPPRLVVPGLQGCESLSRAMREKCQAERYAKLDGRRAPKLNFDVERRYAENPEPFLSRRPKKGCRPRMTGDVDPMGESGNAVAGVTCVIPF